MDRYLVHLVPREDDEPPVELDVTLNVGGAVVSGNLVTEDRYFDLMAERFENIRPNTRERLGEVMDEEIQRRRELGEEKTEQEWAELREEAVEAGYRTASNRMVRSYERAADVGRFIHLRDVVIRTSTLGGGFSTDLWRGKLDAVDGFTIGRSHSDREGCPAPSPRGPSPHNIPRRYYAPLRAGPIGPGRVLVRGILDHDMKARRRR